MSPPAEPASQVASPDPTRFARPPWAVIDKPATAPAQTQPASQPASKPARRRVYQGPAISPWSRLAPPTDDKRRLRPDPTKPRSARPPQPPSREIQPARIAPKPPQLVSRDQARQSKDEPTARLIGSPRARPPWAEPTSLRPAESLQPDPAEPTQDETPQPDTTLRIARAGLAESFGEHRRVVTCEVRLVRRADGRVLAQASAQAHWSQHERLAGVLIEQVLRGQSPAGTIGVVDLCNRRRSETGQAAAREMTERLTDALLRTGQFTEVNALQLRQAVPNERHLESARKLLAGKASRARLVGQDYLLIGGLALRRPVVNLQQRIDDRAPQD